MGDWMDNFCIVVNKQKDVGLEVTDHIMDFMKKKGITCSIADNSEGDPGDRYVSNIPEDARCIIVLGGDGTMLQAARSVVNRDIPLIGVNLGTLGYLTEIEKSGIDEALTKIINDEYITEERMMLYGELNGEHDYALNDIVISRQNTAAINYNIFVNDLYLCSYHADGIIISTPTGSTGYNMSAGGPIVEPSGNMILITPICPHTLNSRSLVLSPETKVVVEIGEGRDKMPQRAVASFDGKAMPLMNTGDKIYIEKSAMTTSILKLSRVGFLENLGRKFDK